MPIQTIVASLVLIHLRDEIDDLKNKLAEVNEKFIEEDLRPLPWQHADINFWSSSLDERINGEYSVRDCIYTEHADCLKNFLALDIRFRQSVEAYNNILIIMREDSGRDMSEFKNTNLDVGIVDMPGRKNREVTHVILDKRYW